ncbi:enoyl-CoA hydratase/isomerase family protein [Acinetobacter bereziniae]|uniref:enoyl-CoA hydratase/isomerase family protein n=1 Tax=Acinetobacter TaxID=469 RepID=UPI00062925A4|nr:MULTISPECIES: enoyl-CoA hydratase-related protein [Acinetobacter]KKW81810.1 enoyl-CoA hydratase [Acinetobacter sp. Ag2]MBJ8424094.1 enoyl-CoA hydratase/isomerase family protein [Acinetobacter bereziniae]MCU4474942.1 enoyl-CoA hydratase/isomerase family protein [Acinetobacter bereziniae]MCU4541614.1 enoyl-CoA hydratase/isomerase family protein [Acinetobacter bereziniae]MCU4627781.1 enoyl-CoA hydratase/isomerase family protein [Acinetobacter bereziniae]
MTLSASLVAQVFDSSIELEQEGSILTLWLNRSDSRNAMSLNMVKAIQQVFQVIEQDLSIRAVILRGKGGHFCAGGDIKDMAQLRGEAMNLGSHQPYVDFNRQFGHMIQQVDQAPQTVVAVLEGAVLGGGFGLACVSDIAISLADAKFGLPETGLGVIPAQIAPFVVKRIGLTQARRLALLGSRFEGHTALKVGVVHEVVENEKALEVLLVETIQQIKRTAPQASRMTKALLHRTLNEPLTALLDDAAQQFAQAVGGEEGMEGTMAFIQKREPNWFDR